MVGFLVVIELLQNCHAAAVCAAGDGLAGFQTIGRGFWPGWVGFGPIGG